MPSDPTPYRTVRSIVDCHPRLVRTAGMLFGVLVQQLLASSLYAARVDYLVGGRVDLSHWQFWFFWDDYWIFLKYLSWPGRQGTDFAIQANAIAALIVLVAYGLWRWGSE